MASPLHDYRGLRGRLPARPGLLRRASARIYGLAALLAGAWAGRAPVHTRLPVISLGNLEIGGTGKTPAVEALARLLAAQGIVAGVVTGMIGAGGGRRLLRSAEDSFSALAPEEARLLAKRLPGVPVVAARRKWEGALCLDRESGCDVILIDDGFQHRRLSRRLDLLLLSGEERLSSSRVLPAGSLREFPRALRRADAFLLPAEAEIAELPQRPCFRFAIEEEGLFEQDGSQAVSDPEGYIAVSAIARPERFETSAGNGRILLERMRFRDHAPWGRELRAALVGAQERHPEARLLLTEKDALRWRGAWDLPGKAPHVLHIRLAWLEADRLWEWLSLALEKGRASERLD